MFAVRPFRVIVPSLPRQLVGLVEVRVKTGVGEMLTVSVLLIEAVQVEYAALVPITLKVQGPAEGMV